MKDVFILAPDGVTYGRVEQHADSWRVNRPFRCVADPSAPLFRRIQSGVAIDDASLVRCLEGISSRFGPVEMASCILPQGYTWHHCLTVDKLPDVEQEVRDFLLWRLNRDIPIEPESVELRHAVTGTSEEGVRILVAVTYRTLVDAVAGAFQGQGVTVACITSPTVAMLNAFDREFPASGAALFLRSGGCSMVAFHGGVPVAIRETDRYLDRDRIEPELLGFIDVACERVSGHIEPAYRVFDERMMRGDAWTPPEEMSALAVPSIGIEGDDDIPPASFVVATGVF